jgi:MFS family permease
MYNNDTKDNNHPTLHFNTKASSKASELRKIFFFACFTTILINLDHGIMPAATKEIRRDLNIDEFDLGLLGSLVYGGLMLGSLTGGYVFQTFSSKKVICATTFLYGAFLIIFPLAESFFWLAMSRVFVGFFQVFMVIYFPVWVDLYGKEKKTIWLTYLQLMVPLGVFAGYGITAVYAHWDNWRYSFYTQIVLLIPCFVYFCMSKAKYMATNNEAGRRRLSLVENKEEGLLGGVRSGSFYQDYNQVKDDSNSPRVSIFEEEEEVVIKTSQVSYLAYLIILWDKKIYVYTVLSIASLYFVVTGIQFWISDYLRVVLELPKNTVFLSFSIVSITAPTIGVLCGGYIVDRFGGYTGKHALTLCIIFGSLAAVFGMPIPFLDSFWPVCILLWMVLFFGGAIMPPITGIMISSVPRNLRAFGQSTAQIFQNLLGYFPAPFLYGYVCKLTGGEKSRWGMIMMFFWSTWGVIGLLFARNAQQNSHQRTRDKIIKQTYVELPDLPTQHTTPTEHPVDEEPIDGNNINIAGRVDKTFSPAPKRDSIWKSSFFMKREDSGVSPRASPSPKGNSLNSLDPQPKSLQNFMSRARLMRQMSIEPRQTFNISETSLELKNAVLDFNTLPAEDHQINDKLGHLNTLFGKGNPHLDRKNIKEEFM